MARTAEGALSSSGKPVGASTTFQGNDRLLFGIILGVLCFWLFAQTTLNIAPDMQKDLGLDAGLMNIAVALTALFSGIFIVVIGGLADRIGRVRTVMAGFVLSIVGSLMIGFAPSGAVATYFLLTGRALQGLSGACVMPASLALVKTYWEGAPRQRAVSMWSIGSWGGSGFCSLFGGFITQNFGWRWIFFASAVVALLGMVLVRGTPESRAEDQASARFDLAGVLTFMTAMVALQIVVTQGNSLGWASPSVLSLTAVALVVGGLFFWIEARIPNAFVDFKLFYNRTYTGATMSNFLLNGAAGTMLVSLQLVQLGGNMTAQQAGMLTLGYAIAIVAFIRVGEKLLRRFGARAPMIQGCLITGFAIVLLLPSNLTLAQYKLFAIVGYTLWHRFGLLRDAFDRRGAVRSASRSGWFGLRNLQDGLIAWSRVRCGDLSGDLQRPQRKAGRGAVAGRDHHFPGAAGQPRGPPGSHGRARLQYSHGAGRHPGDHGHGAEGQENRLNSVATPDCWEVEVERIGAAPADDLLRSWKPDGDPGEPLCQRLARTGDRTAPAQGRAHGVGSLVCRRLGGYCDGRAADHP